MAFERTNQNLRIPGQGYLMSHRSSDRGLFGCGAHSNRPVKSFQIVPNPPRCADASVAGSKVGHNLPPMVLIPQTGGSFARHRLRPNIDYELIALDYPGHLEARVRRIRGKVSKVVHNLIRSLYPNPTTLVL